MNDGLSISDFFGVSIGKRRSGTSTCSMISLIIGSFFFVIIK